MKSVNKTQLFNTLEATVEGHLQQALQLQNQHTGVLLKPAPNGGWSVVQCLEHLNRYGHYYLPAIHKQLAASNGNSNGDTFTSTWLGNYFTRMMDPQTGKKKYKAFKEYIPPANLDAHAIIAEFIHQQETLLAIIAKSRQADITSIKIPISIAKFIKLRLGDVLQFIIAHNERHMQQANNNLHQQDINKKAAPVLKQQKGVEG